TTGFFNPTTPSAANAQTIVPLADPIAIPPIYFIASPAGYNNRSVTGALNQGALYVQDQLSIGSHLQLVGGIRYDRVSLGISNLYTGQRFKRND
ncbi:TonB-dependent receptor domain-containing protein, partial [Streptococcus suis]